MKLARIDLSTFGNPASNSGSGINLGEIGRGSLNNFTLEIDPRGLSQLGSFASGGNKFTIFLIARYADVNNASGELSALQNGGNRFFKPWGEVNPVIPNAPFDIEVTTLPIQPPTGSVAKYLHIWVGLAIGDSPDGAVQINDQISCGIKPSNLTYAAFEVTGDQSGVVLERNMTDFFNSTDINGNVIGDYVAPAP